MRLLSHKRNNDTHCEFCQPKFHNQSEEYVLCNKYLMYVQRCLVSITESREKTSYNGGYVTILLTVLYFITMIPKTCSLSLLKCLYEDIKIVLFAIAFLTWCPSAIYKPGENDQFQVTITTDAAV